MACVSNKSWRGYTENEVGWLVVTVDARVLRAWKIRTRDSFGRACINADVNTSARHEKQKSVYKHLLFFV
jgi:hypothetical protein